MKLDDFDFDLPKKLIAQRPAKPRDHARLLVYDRASREITDSYFYMLADYLVENTTIVLNDTKVEKCRLVFGKYEVFVLDYSDNGRTVRAMVRPGRKFKEGAAIELGGVKVIVETVEDGGVRVLEFSKSINSHIFDPYRLTPLPPYIKQDESLSYEYQTVYSKNNGSKAAPTAGLHFTTQLLNDIAQQYPLASLNLEVGLGTFAPINDTVVKLKKLHLEKITLSKENAGTINKASHITAIGTTTARALETIGSPVHEFTGTTNIFIQPGDKFKVVDSLVTNFHLPRSSLLMMVAAHIGSVDELQRIYKHAIEDEYRFYSFGDAMLIN